MNSCAEKIMNALDLQTVMEHYGIQFNNKGFCRCFLHNEKTASMSVKNQHYKCFGCGAYGSVIDFVREYFNLNFKQAVVKLDGDFTLGLFNVRPSYRDRRVEAENRAIEKRKQTFESDIRDNYKQLTEIREKIYKAYLDNPTEAAMNYIKHLDTILDDFTGEEARAWMK